MATHLICFYTATLGENGDSLGSDEEDIVLLQYLICEVATAKVVSEDQYVLRATSDVIENLMSDVCKDHFGIAQDQIKDGRPIDAAIHSFEQKLKKLNEENAKVFLVTDGQLHLRQVLQPKSVSKGFGLPFFYHTFFDLRKEFKSFYHLETDVQSIKQMLEYLDVPPDSHANLAVKSTREMARIIQRMTSEGHRFTLPEVINTRLEAGICTKGEEVESGCVVRARGLPWQSSDQDIAKFFRGLNIAKGGVALCLSPQGRRNGEALVRFVSGEHRDMALKRHKHHIGNRYIEVYKATGDDFINVAGGNNNEAQQFLSRGGQVIIRMRGLPYDCTAKQVVEFFESGETNCKVLDGEDGVLFVRKPDGRATGDAFVLFATEDDSAAAIAKHREIIGSRYIELFRSTTAEVQQVLNRSMDPKTYEQQQPLIGQLPPVPILPQQFITASSRKDCIRLRGLPYEAQVEHVLEFLGEHAKNIVFRGVHMVINAQGQPSGEAFIQMDNDQSAFLAAQNRHHRYMVFGKKQRYIEVFQCSGEDMNLVLSGGIPAQRAVVSPGMLMWDQSAAAASSSIAQGSAAAASTGVFSSSVPRHPIQSGVLHSSFPHSFSANANGPLMPGIVSPQFKHGSEALWVSAPLLPQSPVRHAILQPSPLDMQTLQAGQASAILPNLKSTMPNVSVQSAIIGQYGEANLAASGLHPGMVLVQSSKYPGAPYSTVAPSPVPMIAVTSAQDSRKNPLAYPMKPISYPSVYPVPVQSGYPGALRAVVPAPGKRSFDQAFTGDKSVSLRPFKRPPPPRLPTAAPSISSGALGVPRLAQSHQLSMANFAQVNIASPFGALSFPPPPIDPTAYYPSPHIYPPAM